MSVTIRLNGEERQVPEGATIATILRELGLDRDGIAVAVDRRVVPRSEHATATLHEGARIEVIRAVGGG